MHIQQCKYIQIRKSIRLDAIGRPLSLLCVRESGRDIDAAKFCKCKRAE